MPASPRPQLQPRPLQGRRPRCAQAVGTTLPSPPRKRRIGRTPGGSRLLAGKPCPVWLGSPGCRGTTVPCQRDGGGRAHLLNTILSQRGPKGQSPRTKPATPPHSDSKVGTPGLSLLLATSVARHWAHLARGSTQHLPPRQTASEPHATAMRGDFLLTGQTAHRTTQHLPGHT